MILKVSFYSVISCTPYFRKFTAYDVLLDGSKIIEGSPLPHNISNLVRVSSAPTLQLLCRVAGVDLASSDKLSWQWLADHDFTCAKDELTATD